NVRQSAVEAIPCGDIDERLAVDLVQSLRFEIMVMSNAGPTFWNPTTRLVLRCRERTFVALRQGLRSPNINVVRHASYVLGQLKDPRALPDLFAATNRTVRLLASSRAPLSPVQLSTLRTLVTACEAIDRPATTAWLLSNSA